MANDKPAFMYSMLGFKFLCNFFRLDGEHVVFGRVIEGMDTVYVIEGAAGTYSGKPRKKVLIADSGEISKSEWEAERESRKTASTS